MKHSITKIILIALVLGAWVYALHKRNEHLICVAQGGEEC